MEAGFCFGGRDVSDGFRQAAIVEPVDLSERGEPDGFEAAPRAAAADGPGPEVPHRRPGERVVAAVADAADGRFDPGFGRAPGVPDRDVLRAAVAAVDRTGVLGRAPPVVSPLAVPLAGRAAARPPGFGADAERWSGRFAAVGR